MIENVKCCCCGAECDYHEFDSAEPCWGNITVVGEIYYEDDYYWEHACLGHEDIIYNGKYKKQ